jgi:hypothetical protein
MDVPSLGTGWGIGGGGRGLLHDFCCLEIQIGRVASECPTDQYSNPAPFMECQIVIKEPLVTFGQEADGEKISVVSYGSGSIGGVGVTSPDKVKDSESDGWITTVGVMGLGLGRRSGGLTDRGSFYILQTETERRYGIDVSYLHGRMRSSNEGGLALDWGLAWMRSQNAVA